MTRRDFFTWTAAAAAMAFRRGQSSGDNLGAAYDMVYQALEKLSATATPEAIRSAMGFLTRALDQSASFGDAHYYLYLCLKRLKESDRLQQMHLDAAQRNRSEALRDRRDPFVLAVPKIYESLPTIGQKHALIVGINTFKTAPPLKAAVNDATLLAATLKDPAVGRFPPGQVYTLLDGQATTGAIKAALNRIATEAKPEDLVFVYFSTHGSSRREDIRQVSYLLTADTDNSNPDLLFGTALPMVEVSGIISTRCVAQRTVLMFDTCHSGASLAGAALSTAEIDRLRAGAGRYIFSSCEIDQRAYEDDEHGFFAGSLIETLRARNGCLRMKDLFAQVRSEVGAKAGQYKKEQRPVMATSESAAEIVLGAAVGAASESCLA